VGEEAVDLGLGGSHQSESCVSIQRGLVSVCGDSALDYSNVNRWMAPECLNLQSSIRCRIGDLKLRPKSLVLQYI
jgi:hypothetical protein